MTSYDPRLYCLVRPLSDEWATTSDGQPVPKYISAVIDVPGHPWVAVMTVVVEADGTAVCTSLGTSRRDRTQDIHEWVHEALTNLPLWGLRDWVRYAVTVAASEARTGAPPLLWPALPDESDTAESLEHWSRVADGFTTQATKRRKATTPAHLLRVATTYNAALAEGRGDPTVAVSEALTMTRSGAAKLVMQCRRTTPPLLPPSSRKKRGQA